MLVVVFLILLAPNDQSAYEEINQLAVNLHIMAFLQQRTAEGRGLLNVEGDERKNLMREVWPLLSSKQRQSYVSVDSHRYYKWLTETMASLRECVIQPEKCNHRFENSRKDNPGDNNDLTSTALQAKNQLPNIQASKRNHETRNPTRMHKHHGTIAKKTQQSKYRSSAKGKAVEAAAWEHRKKRRQETRDASLWEEYDRRQAQNGTAQQAPVDFDRLVHKVCYKPGSVVREYPDKTFYECVVEKLVVPYMGLARWKDRMDYEPYRFLVDPKDSNRSILQWQPDPSTPMSKSTLEEAKYLLRFKRVTVFKRVANCGFESDMVERTLMGEIDHLELGTQRLNRVTSAGRSFRGKEGFYHVFITYALTSTLKKFPALVVVPNAQKEEN